MLSSLGGGLYVGLGDSGLGGRLVGLGSGLGEFRWFR